MARLSWDDHYKSASYETWGSRRNKLQRHSISHYFDKPDEYNVTWSGSSIGTASSLAGAKALAAKDEKAREKRSLLSRTW